MGILASIVMETLQKGTLLEGIFSYLTEKGTFPPKFLTLLTQAKDFDTKLELALEALPQPAGWPLEGSSRGVFVVPPGDTVLKVAMNPAGKYQNRQEAQKNWTGLNPILPQLFSVSQDGSWLEAERAIPAVVLYTPIAFGLKFFGQDIEDLLQEIRANTTNKITPRVGPLQRINIENLERFINSTTPLLGDLRRLKNWGTVKRNGKLLPVLLDYGTTREGYVLHYDIIPKSASEYGEEDTHTT